MPLLRIPAARFASSPRRACALALLVGGIAAACAEPAGQAPRHLARAEALARQGNHVEAILEYRNALKQEPRNGDIRLKLAGSYLETQNLAAAGQEFIRAADLLPDRPDVQLKAATVLLAVKEFESARKYAELALRAQPDAADAHIVRALALAGLRDVGAALRELQDAMIAAPADARPHITMGALRALEARRPEAEAAFRKAVAVDSTSTTARTALAFYLWSSQRTPEAIRVLDEALSIAPEDPALNRLLALFHLSEGNDAAADAPLRRLADAGDATAAIALGDLYFRARQYMPARQSYERVDGQSAQRPVALARLGALEYSMGAPAAAWQTIEKGLVSFPKSAHLWMAKARWLLTERRPAEAVDAAHTAVLADPQSVQAHFLLGTAHTANGQEREAIDQFREALYLDPRMGAADVELSRLLLRSGETAQAVQHAVSARSSAPHDYATRLAFARALAAADGPARVQAEARELVAAYPRAAGARALYGQVLQASGDRTRALQSFDIALSLDPAELTALSARVAEDLQQNRADTARARLAEALKHPGDRAGVLILAAELEHAVGNGESAERHLRAAIEAEPNGMRAYAQLAHLYVSLNRLAEGKQELLGFLKRRPDSVPVRTMVAMIEEIQGQPEAAIAIYESIVTTSDKAPVAANNLAFLYLERGVQLERALQLAEAARSQLPGEPGVRDTLGWAYFKTGMTNEAIRELEAAVEARPRHAGYRARLGFAYERAGRSDQARRAFQQALQLNPNLAAAAEIRSRLAYLEKTF